MTSEISKIKMLIMDVDGVLTSGDVIYGNDSIEIKVFNIQDGMGVTLARAAGLKVGAITGRESAAVKRRLSELGFDIIIQNCPNKIDGYSRVKAKFNLKDNEIAYIGDDILDIPVMQKVGIPIGVQNSVAEVKAICKFISTRTGGKGAVREIIEWIITKQNKYKQALDIVLSTIQNPDL
jgi:3-deoxy-D-manno-octulosonate 8-phosphate phosphatase (KDO 8-P phosphatase)